MKKALKLSAVVLAFLGCFLVALAKTSKVESNVGKLELSSGKLYSIHCAICHGADGKGNTKKGMDLAVPDLTTSRISSDSIRNVISNGDGEMPAFRGKLKASQINSLVRYTRALRK